MSSLCCVFVLIVSVHSHRRPHGLSCTSDLVDSVTCSWENSSLGPGDDCWVSGVKKAWNQGGRREDMRRSCRLEPLRDAPLGCSLVYEGKRFFPFETMPSIRVNCSGTEVGQILDYKPVDHIKMNPPGRPSVNTSDNHTWVSWSPGRPPNYVASFDFQVQLRRTRQTWGEAATLDTQEPRIRIPESQLEGGPLEVRVRARPAGSHTSIWSNWSPSTSWRPDPGDRGDRGDRPGHQEPGLDQMSELVLVLVFSLCLFVCLVLVLEWSCRTKGPFKRNPVPSPSEYFHSVHGGNLKKWLNPVSETFFRAQPREQISPVEVCDVWDVPPSTSPSSSSTSALLRFQTFDSSSSSSSFVSNVGYFMSSSAPGDPSLAYFTYRDDFHHPSPSPSPSPWPRPSLDAYESLRAEPQSPDSGFGLRPDDGSDGDDGSAAFIILPLQLLPEMCPPSSLPPPPPPPSVSPAPPVGQQVEGPVAAAAAAVAVVSRASSMPVNPCQSDYLTLKELQTTFSNKSI